MANQVTTQTGLNALSKQQQQEHRAKIGVRVQAILSQFWRDGSTPDAVQALEFEGWMDVLENCSHSEIRNAWASYQRTGPRTQTGKLYKPDAGALYQIILRSRPRPRPGPEARPMTAEERKAAEERRVKAREINPERKAQAEKIIREVGIGTKMDRGSET